MPLANATGVQRATAQADVRKAILIQEPQIFLACVIRGGACILRQGKREHFQLRIAAGEQDSGYSRTIQRGCYKGERGLILKKGAIMDSTIISSSSSARNRKKKRDS